MHRAIFTCLLALASCSHRDSTTPPPPEHGSGATPIVKDPAQARQLIAGGAVVLDVRTPDEYAGGHLQSATNVPIDGFGDRLAEIDKLVAGDKTKPVVVYCAKGGRAARAKQQLEAAGYAHVVNGGGYDDLRSP